MDPGIAGLVLDSSGTPIPGAAVKVSDSMGKVVYLGTTDQDGFYSYSFKYTGKATTFTIQITYNGKTATQTITKEEVASSS